MSSPTTLGNDIPEWTGTPIPKSGCGQSEHGFGHNPGKLIYSLLSGTLRLETRHHATHVWQVWQEAKWVGRLVTRLWGMFWLNRRREIPDSKATYSHNVSNFLVPPTRIGWSNPGFNFLPEMEIGRGYKATGRVGWSNTPPPTPPSLRIRTMPIVEPIELINTWLLNYFQQIPMHNSTQYSSSMKSINSCKENSA